MCITSSRQQLKATGPTPVGASLLKGLTAKHETLASLRTPASYDISEVMSSLFKGPKNRQKPETEDKQPHPKKAKLSHPHIIVQHDYHDHSHDNSSAYREEHPARGGVLTPFPLKLHQMLESVATDGHEDIISWQKHGRCFIIHKPKEFVDLLHEHFKLSKLASFQRQLNLYGFQRITRGRDRGGYYHELFLRGKVYLANKIQRTKVKGTGVRARSNPENEPDFWNMPWVEDDEEGTVSTPISSPSMPAALTSAFLPLNKNVSSTNPVDDDVVCAFGNKTFHYLDPFQQRHPKTGTSAWALDDFLPATEADAFFDNFEFPEDIGSDIEDDLVFGQLLEEFIA